MLTSRIANTFLIVGLLTFTNCAPQTDLEDENVSEKVTEKTDDGRSKSSLSKDSDSIIEVNDTALKGTSMAVSAGTFAVDTEVYFEEGESLANVDLSQSLGLGDDATLTSAGPAVVVSASEDIDGIQPFTLSIPVTEGASLLTATDQLVIVYKIRKASEG